LHFSASSRKSRIVHNLKAHKDIRLWKGIRAQNNKLPDKEEVIPSAVAYAG
jgi:hypothetical protein